MLEVQQLSIVQDGRQLWDCVSFQVRPGERQGISAPSGYGKTTLGRVLAQWQSATSGSITVDGKALAKKGYCPVQLVPQHPEQTFNPYRTTGESLRDAWSPDAAWLARLAVNPGWLARRPDELSGGELARIALLRALDPRTRYLIADEVTAQLDAHVQAQVWQVLLEETRRRELGMIVFSHNKALLQKVCSSIWLP
ncbi:ATP-binding cassette domain-containing protein [Pseudomonas sp. FSL R10-0056]|jgi:ABC-type dipeptide/oligopeptide/nickel transport system, ATPase component|uniref:ABC transporter n=2 Tax=Pseudomonas TaxID=286 RepID=A0A267AQ39_PSEFR|nr:MULTISPECIES: ATP-binding cassette domain-containing protein [Pseudomonas]MBO5394150.1 ATP-binding cassette domain-containing protein [Pseudomonas sp.]MBO6276724.1 ATP-binding cassette domain-containing protein [Pseudomonas sp.]MBP3932910.1 ATP-binding cassette domain-containing protein [Pseudomonas sp.]MCH4885460.1 ATP-binding cassette domain-containing protein [Pseudomonas sp. TMW22080]MDN5390409.1 ATP-binding cassette domain-containing protein [Pseudomonas sp.]